MAINPLSRRSHRWLPSSFGLRQMLLIQRLKKKNRVTRLGFCYEFMPLFYSKLNEIRSHSDQLYVKKVKGGALKVYEGEIQPEPDRVFPRIVKPKQLDNIIVPKGKKYRVTVPSYISPLDKNEIFVAALSRNIQYRDE